MLQEDDASIPTPQESAKTVFASPPSSVANCRYNAFARKLDARLRQLGAEPLVSRVLGDAAAAGGVEAGLGPFLASLERPLGVDVKTTATLAGRVGDEAPEDVAAYFSPRGYSFDASRLRLRRG